LSYFFSFDYKRTRKQQIANKSKDKKLFQFSKELGKGLSDQSSYRLFPLGKNEILVRFENLADAFDVANMQSLAQLDLAQSVNLNEFADELYKEVNGNSPRKIEIVETDLQGVHLHHQNFKWKALETGTESLAEALHQQVKAPPADGFSFTKVYIGPQSLRSFRIKYSPQEQQSQAPASNAQRKLRSKITLKRIDSKNLMKSN
jgi:hypothetical protein